MKILAAPLCALLLTGFTSRLHADEEDRLFFLPDMDAEIFDTENIDFGRRGEIEKAGLVSASVAERRRFCGRSLVDLSRFIAWSPLLSKRPQRSKRVSSNLGPRNIRAGSTQALAARIHPKMARSESADTL